MVLRDGLLEEGVPQNAAPEDGYAPHLAPVGGSTFGYQWPTWTACSLGTGIARKIGSRPLGSGLGCPLSLVLTAANQPGSTPKPAAGERASGDHAWCRAPQRSADGEASG